MTKTEISLYLFRELPKKRTLGDAEGVVEIRALNNITKSHAALKAEFPDHLEKIVHHPVE